MPSHYERTEKICSGHGRVKEHLDVHQKLN